MIKYYELLQDNIIYKIHSGLLRPGNANPTPSARAFGAAFGAAGAGAAAGAAAGSAVSGFGSWRD